MYTRKGDKGDTSLYGSRRVSKDNPRVEAYGTIDELNSLLGAVVAELRGDATAASLIEVQRMLFVAGGDAATELHGRQGVPRIDASHTKRLEQMTDDLLKKLPPLANFVLPGGTSAGALLHLSRSVCRRAERRLVSAMKAEEMNPELLPFFNRLSSYLFDLARTVNMQAGREEEIWKP